MVGIDRWGKEYASFSKSLCESNAGAEGVVNISFGQGDATKLGFDDETFDAVTSNYVYHNIPSRDRQAILLETMRTLKKGGTIETRMRKAKREFIRIEMLVVRKEFQGKGYMKQMMEYTYALAKDKNVPIILDTDDKDKALRYEHLGMKLDKTRNCGERFHMYDLIRESV